MSTTTAITCKKIDIHSHLLYGVDDGSKILEDSLEALKVIKAINITDIVCTPHFFDFENHDVRKEKENFENLKKIFQKENINLHLGNEIALTADTLIYLQNKCVNTLGNTKYILVDLGRKTNKDKYYIYQQFENLIDNGYNVILAHPELYENYRDIEFITQLKELGVIMQLDSESILKHGIKNRKVYKYSKKLLKKKLIDVVASDYHDNIKRNYKNFEKAYKYILKKYKYEYTNRIFYLNPKRIIESEKI